jgi:hypothetical protein
MSMRNLQQMVTAGLDGDITIYQSVHFRLAGAEVAQPGQRSRSSLPASLLILKARCTGLRQQMPGVHRALAGNSFSQAKSSPG